MLQKFFAFFQSKSKNNGNANYAVVAYIREQFLYTPTNVEAYVQAINHKSKHESILANNERLEFLGDSVLDAIITQSLFRAYPGQDEGFLTKMRAKIVSRKTLNEIAVKTGLDKLVDAKLEHDTKNTSVGGNAFEALIGAIYLEKGFDFTQNVVEKRIIERFINFNELEGYDFDPKSKLIELCQKNKWELQFETKAISSPGKQLLYETQVIINGKNKSKGEGTSKKKAEQVAAKIFLDEMFQGQAEI